MISKCHSTLIYSVNRRIQRYLDRVEAETTEVDGRMCSTAISRDAKSIKGTGDGSVDLGKAHYSPDSSYTFGYEKIPSLVVEIAWSQPDEDLKRKARRYITWSKGIVKTVVAVSLNGTYRHVNTVSKTRRIREEDFDLGEAKFFVYRSNVASPNLGTVLESEDKVRRLIVCDSRPFTDSNSSM